MSRLHAPDWAAIIDDLLAHGITARDLARELDLVSMSDKLLKHYREGGQPNFPRGDYLLSRWEEVTNRPSSLLDLLDWTAPHRVQSDSMQMHKRCHTCGQILRKAILAQWEQMGLHKERFGGLPNWPVAAPASVKPIKRRKAR